MSGPLRVLIVDDSENDALLVAHELESAGYVLDSVRVQDAAALRCALAARDWDIVLSDWAMPRFSALAALEVVKASGIDVPFIMVSGTVGEETVVAALRAGAHDFVSKDKLARLTPAVARELRESEGRKARRRAEEELRKAAERYRLLFESSPLPMWVYEVESLRFLAVNDAAIRHYGYSREEFATSTLADVRPPEELASLRDDVARQEDDSGPKVWRHRKKDGSIIQVEVRAHGFELDGKKARLVLINDVTDRLRAEEALRTTEEQLRQAQKMEAIGSLAGGIAHDFNNLLSVILSYSSLLLADMRDVQAARDDILEIQKAGQRAADLTRQLLAFSRQQVLEPRVLDLNGVITQIDKMIRRLVGEDVELRTIPARGLWRAKVDPGQIEQVIMNLVVNARDAMPKGGRLTIETSNVELDEDYASDHPGVVPGPHVMLAVSDTGSGMDKATQARIFEPFFTTKEVGKGTGLGLSTVFGIVKQSGGSIWVYSEPGRGTTFKLCFPRSGEETVLRAKTPSSPTMRGVETVLVVEDEPQLRALARVILTKSGYHVLESAGGSEALTLVERFSGKIHLLVTDVVMPEMSGRELAETLTAKNPAMKVLYMSGYTDNTIVHHGVLQPGVAFLQKPITPEVLARKVREVLDG